MANLIYGEQTKPNQMLNQNLKKKYLNFNKHWYLRVFDLAESDCDAYKYLFKSKYFFEFLSAVLDPQY